MLTKEQLVFIQNALLAKGPNGAALLAVPLENAREAADVLDAVRREIAAFDATS